ncbi:MAG: efflux RND transporter periplasmic adaptor subunit [Crocinitomicaceae bacterium]|nr:efflux RND transporter periplasmic adaptor subunit [Crocinitomicaceae bacterium]MBK8927401.1 efflux RND transporter periplasmic adaptor subunit [Crocinitomicaceae bacterium]
MKTIIKNKIIETSRSKFFYLFIISLSLFGCGGSAEEKVDEHAGEHEDAEDVVELTQSQYESAEVGLGNVEMRTISGTIPASGFLDTPPQSKISISAPMGGFVKSTKLLEGSPVKKGQVVAVMQHPDYIKLQQDYLENVSQLEFLKSEYERQEELAKENVNARKSLEKAKADYNTTKATVQGLKATLQMLNISITELEKGEIQNTVNLYSPISGYVTKVNTNIGAFVNPTDVLFEIVNTQKLHVELTIFEKDIPNLEIGQRVLFTLADGTESRVARIQLIGREISHDRSIQVHCEIEGDDMDLIPGMYLNAVIETDSAKVTSLPEEAVVHFEGKDYIFVLTEGDPTSDEHAGHNEEGHEEHEGESEEGHDEHGHGGEGEEPAAYHFQMIEVTKGELDLGYVQIVLPDGFDASSKVAVKGAYAILAKMKNSESEGGHAH